jgi:hypothetical protein
MSWGRNLKIDLSFWLPARLPRFSSSRCHVARQPDTFDQHVSTWENTLLMELRMKFRL